jgi:hypothetical protein
MKTKPITRAVLPFEVGEARAFAGLTIVPLFASDPPALGYIGLDEAVARGLDITEVDESGSVGTLRVKNPLDELVLLYEGEELVGAKQNRILARTILVDARSALEIPVACVEQGRWSFAAGTSLRHPAPPTPSSAALLRQLTSSSRRSTRRHSRWTSARRPV